MYRYGTEIYCVIGYSYIICARIDLLQRILTYVKERKQKINKKKTSEIILLLRDIIVYTN